MSGYVSQLGQLRKQLENREKDLIQARDSVRGLTVELRQLQKQLELRQQEMETAKRQAKTVLR